MSEDSGAREKAPLAAKARTSGPMRRCALSRRQKEQSALLRLVVSDDGAVGVDLRGRGPGRGVYVEPAELANALSKKRLGQLFRGRARPLSEQDIHALIAHTRARLSREILSLVGLARRSGGLAIGAESVRRAVEGGRAHAVLLAKDAAPRTQRNTDGLCRQYGVPTLVAATRSEFGALLSRERVSVLAVEHEKIAARLCVEVERASALRLVAEPESGEDEH